MCIRRFIVLSCMCLLSTLVNAHRLINDYVTGTLTFYNKTHETINVVVNQDPSKGVPIGLDGLELSYSLINVICSASTLNCQTEFTSAETEKYVGSAEIDVTTGTLINYSAALPYKVILNPQEIPLRSVTFDRL